MTIRLSENFRALFYAPFYAADATRAYSAAGVDVEIVPSPDPAATGQALRAGTVDVMWGGPLRVLIMAEREPEAGFVCFCNAVERDPFFVIGRQPNSDFALAALTTMTLAPVSEVPTPWLCLQQDIRDAGLDPTALHLQTGRSMAENVAALSAGSVDAVQLFQPYAEQMLADGTGHLLFAQASRGLTAYTTLVTTRATLADRAEELQAMVLAMARTLSWFDQTEAAEIAGVIEPYFPDIDCKLLTACIARYQALGLWARSPVLDPAGFERLQTSMLSAGVLTRQHSFQSCVDNSLAERVMQTG